MMGAACSALVGPSIHLPRDNIRLKLEMDMQNFKCCLKNWVVNKTCRKRPTCNFDVRPLLRIEPPIATNIVYTCTLWNEHLRL